VGTRHQVIKEHFDGRQVLLNRLGRTRVLFYIGGYMHRGDQPQIIDALLGPT
jgi:hypothetical protein